MSETEATNVVSIYRHADRVRAIVSEAPELTQEQKDRISALLAVGKAGGPAAA